MTKLRRKSKQREEKKKLREQSGAERQRTLLRLAGMGIVVVLLGIIVMMIASQFYPEMALLDAPRKFVSRVITPVQSAFSSATDGVAGYLRRLKLRSNLEHEYEQLLARLEEMTDRTMLYEANLYQLQEYADLDDEMRRNQQLDGIKANIIGRDTSNYTFTLTIDAGTDQGIDRAMAVVYNGALVGYIDSVEKNSATVRAIVDTNASVNALIESSRDQGQISGTLAIDGTYACRMYYLTYTTLPRPGDRVVTSGVGLEFIKGIPIGHVRESTRGQEDSKQFIVVEPIVDFNHLEYVVVFRYRPLYPEPAEERGTQVSSTHVPLPSIQPVPTFIGQPEPVLTPGPDGAIPDPSQETPEPSPTVSPTPRATEDPNATPRPENFAYNVKPVVLGTPTPEPSPTPDPTPEPAPTFSVEQQTVEEDE